MEDIEYNEMHNLICAKYFTGLAPKIIRNVSKRAKQFAETQKVQKTTEVENDPLKDMSLLEAIKYKSDYTKSMLPTYAPAKVESHWNEWWEQKNYFHCDAKDASTVPHEKRFLMNLPPPNVTGVLHVGHALTTAVEDSMCRRKRMQGFKTMYLPGSDHAGIATQSVVEKQLAQKNLPDRKEMGREAFLKKVWEWKEQTGDTIMSQMRRLAGSMDWERSVFTMDETRSVAVTEAFVRLYEKGIIFRSNRLVNWDCTLKTAVSDMEVDFEEFTKPTRKKIPGNDKEVEFGVMINFAYKIKGMPDKEIVVGTTRIETMLGDTGLAVNSTDPRYKDFIGCELIHPFVPDRVIKVITDDELVDINFGTGAVKLTPAHDPNDFKSGQKNGLECINILNEDGTMNENTGKYKGMKRYEVREQIIKDLESLDLYRGKDSNPMRIGFSQRSGDVIEPCIKPQWYMKGEESGKQLVKVVEDKELVLIPERFDKIWNHFCGNLQDWCISRQLWWGHRIPAYICKVKGGAEPNTCEGKDWVVGRNYKEAMANACKKYGKTEDQLEISQDEDVLDTWFSSGLFPFSVQGWPTPSLDLDTLFPISVMETGHDILFFWVARMCQMSLLLTGKLPFKTVFLHSIVRDENGEKMSKSKGNIIDPLEVINGCTIESIIEKINQSTLPEKEKIKGIANKKKKFPIGIPECGSDALRFGLLNLQHIGKDIN